MEEEFCKGHSNRMPITLRRRPNRAIRLRPDPLKRPRFLSSPQKGWHPAIVGLSAPGHDFCSPDFSVRVLQGRPSFTNKNRNFSERRKEMYMDKVGLFFYYNHQDKIIADTLVEALAFVSQTLDVFIDHSGLEGGDDYEDKIHKSISKSLWFIIICPLSITSRRDMSYCFYEAGQFQARLGTQNSIAEVRNRICCLYEGQIPGPLSRYQGTRVSSINRDGRQVDLFRMTHLMLKIQTCFLI